MHRHAVTKKNAFFPGDNGKNVLSISPTVATDSLEDFIIPELPKGKVMEFDITSTWGDKHYVGLNGIELFNDSGQPIKIKEVSQKSHFCSQLDFRNFLTNQK